VKEWIAERKLLVTKKGDDKRSELSIQIGCPYKVEPGSVNFDVDEGVSGCTIEITGLENVFREEVYGADQLQAIQLATNVDPLLRWLGKQYDLFFPSGEPYFEDGE